MAGESFSIKIDDAQVRAALQRLAGKVKNATPVMQDISRALVNITEDAFAAETSPFGQKWPALSENYVERPRKKGGRGGDAAPILQRSGQLAGSLHGVATATTATVGVSKIYAAIHQFGGTPGMLPGPAAVPKRPYLPIDQAGNLAPTAQREILAILADYLK